MITNEPEPEPDRAPSPGPRPPDMTRLRELMAAELELRFAETRARADAGWLHPARRSSAAGPSSVFTVRLSHEERAALELRAKAVELKPSVLARNLIRRGLTRTPQTAHLTADRLERACDELDSILVELRADLDR